MPRPFIGFNQTTGSIMAFNSNMDNIVVTASVIPTAQQTIIDRIVREGQNSAQTEPAPDNIQFLDRALWESVTTTVDNTISTAVTQFIWESTSTINNPGLIALDGFIDAAGQWHNNPQPATPEPLVFNSFPFLGTNPVPTRPADDTATLSLLRHCVDFLRRTARQVQIQSMEEEKLRLMEDLTTRINVLMLRTNHTPVSFEPATPVRQTKLAALKLDDEKRNLLPI